MAGRNAPPTTTTKLLVPEVRHGSIRRDRLIRALEAAAKRLSADVITFSAKGSSISKGESLKDTAQTIAAMGVDAVVLRHGGSGAARGGRTGGQ